MTLPAEVKGLPGAWIVIPAEVEGGKPKWRLSAGIEEVRLDVLFPAELLDKAKGKVVVANKAGRYVVEAWNAAGDEASDIATAVVIVGNPPPQPEPPGPGPAPDPPKPPVVDVPDELAPAVAALAAFPKQRAELGKFYRDFAKVVESSNLTTTGQFRTAHANALKTFVAATGYTAPKVGTHIDAYLAECIGGLEDKPLNAELKARLAAALKTIGEVMQ